MSRRVYPAKQVAEALRMSPRSVRRMIERGDLDAIRAGQRYLIPRESIKTYLLDRYLSKKANKKTNE